MHHIINTGNHNSSDQPGPWGSMYSDTERFRPHQEILYSHHYVIVNALPIKYDIDLQGTYITHLVASLFVFTNKSDTKSTEA